jgi:putative heme-binding domain-containing protein
LLQGDIGDPKYIGHVWEGYSLRRSLPLVPPLSGDGSLYKAVDWDVIYILRKSFPTGVADLDREITRTLAMNEEGDADSLKKIADHIRDEKDPVETIHYLIVLSRLAGKRNEEISAISAKALYNLPSRLDGLKTNRDLNWGLRIRELQIELARKDDRFEEHLFRLLNTPQDVFFAVPMTDHKKDAAKKFVERVQRYPGGAWTPDVVSLLGELTPGEYRSALRQLWSHGGLEDAILTVLAREPDVEDEDKFLSGLASPKLALVRACLEALNKLPARDDGPALLALVRGLRMLPDGKEVDAIRPMFADALKKRTNQDIGPDKSKWTAWFERTYPDLAKKLGGPDGVDVAAWQKRLAGVDWSKGEPQRGKTVFQKAGCINCHSGSLAMGPDLTGAGNRFSRDDLFTAIIQPSKDISPRYRTTQIETTDGKTYQGLIVYEAVDGVILQTGPAETVRIDGKKIESRRLTDTSLMPVGLIDKFSDVEIADLYAFLRAK